MLRRTAVLARSLAARSAVNAINRLAPQVLAQPIATFATSSRRSSSSSGRRSRSAGGRSRSRSASSKGSRRRSASAASSRRLSPKQRKAKAIAKRRAEQKARALSRQQEKKERALERKAELKERRIQREAEEKAYRAQRREMQRDARAERKEREKLERADKRAAARERHAESKTRQEAMEFLKKLRHRAAEWKDPNAPKRPPSAYLLFVNANRERITKENPGIAVPALAKKAGEEWKAATAEVKNKFIEQAKAEKAKYEKAVEEYESKALKAPKRPLTPYLAFAADFRPANLSGVKDIKEQARRIGEAWKKLSEAEKEKYNSAYQVALNKWKTDVEAFKAKTLETMGKEYADILAGRNDIGKPELLPGLVAELNKSVQRAIRAQARHTQQQ